MTNRDRGGFTFHQNSFTSQLWRRMVLPLLLAITTIAILGGSAQAQSTGAIQGTVVDTSGGAVPNATVTIKNLSTQETRTLKTDSVGSFLAPSLPVGTYSVTIDASGLQKTTINNVIVEVSRTTAENVHLKVASTEQTVEVTSAAPVIDSTTMTVGTVINQRTVQDIPLNGRHFVDLGLLIPGSVTPPQNGFLTAPLRGQGSFAFNTAGAREDMVNFMINGINLNDQVQNQITFQPTINTVREFKVDNSSYSAEYGRNAGAIVNIATRSGTNQFHGSAYDFVRNDFFDARNYFNPTTDSSGKPLRQSPFKRNQFGATLGGPIWKNHTFFFVSYEGLRQRQGLNTNAGVLSDAQRSTVQSSGVPQAQALLNLIPIENSFDAKGNPRFLGSATAPVDIDQWTGDFSHTISTNDRLHGYYAFQKDHRQEATAGVNVTGFGDLRDAHRQILTLDETHIFSPRLVNDVRIGFNRIHITFIPFNTTNPNSLAIGVGADAPNALPRISFAFTGLVFGGPTGEPQGRGDTTAVFGDTVNYLHGRHNFKFGAEVRTFRNGNFGGDTGSITFNTFNDFLAGQVNFFARTPGTNPNRITQDALDWFVQDSFKLRPDFTLELGLRYAWNKTPTEALDRFVVFDTTTGSLVRVGNGIDSIYHQNNKDFQPRVGFAWDMRNNGRYVLRAGYGFQTQEPNTNYVTGLASNPPFSSRVSFNSATGAPIATVASFAAAAAGVSPATINPHFKDANLQSWNLNLQFEPIHDLGLMLGYFANKGTHLEIERNLNQPVNGVEPFTAVAADSPIAPGALLGNITARESSGISTYNALWFSANKRMSHGLQFNASYTWSHAIDLNSLNREGVVVQNSYNIFGDKGNADFDVRHRLVFSPVYDLPFKGNRFVEGWEIASILTIESGNPFTIFAPPSVSGINLTALNNVGGIRPDVVGPIALPHTVDQWFVAPFCNPIATSPCPAGTALVAPIDPTTRTAHFGNLGRNTLVGPPFRNWDFSIHKTTKVTERTSLEFRADAFDILNHPNFAQPGSTLGSSTFGVITSTRFPTGDYGSSRQLQLALTLKF